MEIYLIFHGTMTLAVSCIANKTIFETWTHRCRLNRKACCKPTKNHIKTLSRFFFNTFISILLFHLHDSDPGKTTYAAICMCCVPTYTTFKKFTEPCQTILVYWMQNPQPKRLRRASRLHRYNIYMYRIHITVIRHRQQQSIWRKSPAHPQWAAACCVMPKILYICN